MKSKFLALVGILVALGIFAAACGSDSDDGDNVATDNTAPVAATTAGTAPATTEAVRVSPEECTEELKGGEVNFGIFSETSGLDPTVTSGSGVTGAIELSALFGTLVLQNPQTGEFYPYIAESLEPNDDFSVWTLKLREGTRFGNGDIMTTTHVRDSMLRFVAPDKNLALQRNQAGSWVQFIEEYEIIDDLNMRFHLDSPWSGFPYTLGDEPGMIINTAILEERGLEEFNRNPLGAGVGPYEFVRYTPRDEIVLEAKDDYWMGPVCIQQLRFIRLSGAAATYEAWQQDELQVAFLREAEPIADARANGDDNAIVFLKNLGGVWLTNVNFQGSTPITSDVRIRKAIALALDAENIDQRANNGTGLPNKSLLHPESPLYDAALFPEIPDDLAEARRLVEEVKAEGDWDGSLRLECHNAPSRIEYALASEALLEAAGFDVEISNDGTILDLIAVVFFTGNWDTACWGFNLAEFEPYTSMLQHTCDSPSNRTGYCNPDMDDAIAALRVASNNDEYQAAWARVWEIWQETIPSVPVNLTEEYILFKDNIKGVIGSQDSVVTFHKAFIEQ